ncbi:MAG TPA: hypothetical protein VHW60_03180, partial [Caulobacteraceae bacterium]|nr:hypothetical protein [Caulobacteraceae bacterium]
MDTLYDQRIRPELSRRERQRRTAIAACIVSLAALSGLTVGAFILLHALALPLAVAALVVAARFLWPPLRRITNSAQVEIVSIVASDMGL